MIDLEAEFTLLEIDSRAASGVQRELGPGLTIGRDPAGLRLLIVDIGDDPVNVRDRSHRSVWVTTYRPQGEPARLVLECRDPQLNQVFTAMAAEMAGQVEEVPPDQRRSVLQRNLERWSKLLASGAKPPLSREAQAGIVGELVVLERAAAVDPNAALESWKGPLKAPHDFKTSSAAIEVKTTTSREAFSVTIHGLTQLDPPADGAPLHLAGVRVIEDPTGVGLYRRVERLLEVVDPSALLTRLGEMDYVHDEEAQDWTRFVHEAPRFWRYTADLPGLRASAIPESWRDAISQVRYVLDLSVLGEPLADDAVDALWGSA